MRRILLALPFLSALAGCVAEAAAPTDVAAPTPSVPTLAAQALAAQALAAQALAASDMDALYGEVSGERFRIAPLDVEKIAPRFRRQVVDYATSEPAGTLVVDPDAHFLYLVEPGGKARRYGVAVGREGASWAGTATIRAKQEWPDWYPTPEMLERRPDIKEMLTALQSGPGIAGGLDNPIGARGMYLWQGGKDTLYRIHGTTEPYSIGSSVSSGCIRMTNQDVIDLYSRVAVGATVKVLPANPKTASRESASPETTPPGIEDASPPSR